MPKHLMLMDVEHASIDYHDRGSAAVIADSLDEAREVVAASFVCELDGFHTVHTADCYGRVGYEMSTEPPVRAVFELAENQPPRAIFFPDSGCC